MAGRRAFPVLASASIGFAALSISALPAMAQSAAEFYKGRQITLIVSSGPGGGYDTYSRLLARFIGRHFPAGEPRIVVQNMPGADGITSLNYIANVAARDGSVIADTNGTMPFYNLLDGRNSKFDPLKLNWLGSISKQISVCIAWAESPFKTIDDAIARRMRLSGTGAGGWRVTLPRLYNLIAGTKFEMITGYATPNDYLAIERGEVEGSCTTYDTLRATKQNWIVDKKIRFLTHFGVKAPEGLEGVQNGLDKVGDVTDRKAMELVLSQQESGRPYVTAPEVPADRLKVLRDAFDATMKDPDFIEAARTGNLSHDPLNAAQVNTLIRNAYASPPEIVQRAKSLLERALPH